ncbi:FAD/NAD(P)-binding protein [Spirillospora sp. NPDC048819]|uniref:FAD/NAD(P)-binding protein n=1 Tax=Spirillospora sp. NPDC048819 TaxID=3155268 RepID=UPI0033FD9E0E
MSDLDVALIGLGPRGLSVRERLLVRLHAAPPDGTVTIWAFDRVEHGAGRIWRTGQPPWLAANTSAAEVSIHSADSPLLPRGGGHPHSMVDWAGLAPDQYPSRRLYGRYLAQAFESLRAKTPRGVDVRPVLEEVTSMTRAEAGRLRITAGDVEISVDKAVIATGHPELEPTREEIIFRAHAAGHPGTGYIGPGLAAEMPLEEIPPDATMAIRGLGLTFYDLVRSMTIGRGGRFTEGADGDLRYIPSGHERRLLAGSRSGLPFLARPDLSRSPQTPWRPTVLTEERLQEARDAAAAGRGTRQLDFAAEIEPLIGLEAAAHCPQFTGGTDSLLRLARPFDGRHFAGMTAFRGELVRLLRDDVDEARKGVAGSRAKAATETLRMLRPVLAGVVDFGGLLPRSHEDFLTRFVPASYILSAGPPASHVAQLVALLEAGVLEVVGPGFQVRPEPGSGGFTVRAPSVRGSEHRAAILIDAHTPSTDLARDTAPLIRQLMADGMVTEHATTDPATGRLFRPGGLATTPAPYHVIRADQSPDPDIHALGVVTDGTRWFTQVGSGRPGQDSPFHQDADTIAASILNPTTAVRGRRGR